MEGPVLSSHYESVQSVCVAIFILFHLMTVFWEIFLSVLETSRLFSEVNNKFDECNVGPKEWGHSQNKQPT